MTRLNFSFDWAKVALPMPCHVGLFTMAASSVKASKGQSLLERQKSLS